jgi:hypothetical protein
MVFRNVILKKILEPKRKEATGEWSTLHNELTIYDPNQKTL